MTNIYREYFEATGSLPAAMYSELIEQTEKIEEMISESKAALESITPTGWKRTQSQTVSIAHALAKMIEKNPEDVKLFGGAATMKQFNTKVAESILDSVETFIDQTKEASK
jgi:hypothetical protein